uniref:Ceramide synthase 3a n=1 Tax=Oryzias sinensis TaxID=183150 RepID=A0A8C7WT11_9TELE
MESRRAHIHTSIKVEVFTWDRIPKSIRPSVLLLVFQADMLGLSKKSGLSMRQVERWFRRRRVQDHPGVLKKFKESRSEPALPLHSYKEWLYDSRQVWTGYPQQSLLESQYWYYILEMSFYGCLFFSIASDVKRKDFREQIIHHVATLVLLSFSWCANFIRVGTLVILVHDASDVLLESAKMFNYAGWEKTSKALFVAFAVIFMVTRLVIFPFWIIHCTWVYPLHHYPAFFGYYFFNAMLVVLLCLHLFWSSLILRMIRKFLFGTVSLIGVAAANILSSCFSKAFHGKLDPYLIPSH